MLSVSHKIFFNPLASIAGSKAALQQSPTRNKRLLRWYMSMDVLAMVIGLFSAWGLAAVINGVFFGRAVIDPFSDDGMVRVSEFMMIAMAVIIWFQNTEHYHICMPFWIESRKIVTTLAFAGMADGFLQFASKHDLSRLWLVSGWVIAAIAMMALRSMMRDFLRTKGRFQMRTLLVGDGITAQHTREALQSDPCLNYDITAQI